MSVSSVTSTTAAQAANGNATSVLPTQALNQSDFLKLLVAQLSSQDPMNPQSNTDFAAQMAQFSALQTSQQTQSSVTQLATAQQGQQANSLIGRAVTLADANGNLISGNVGSVQFNSGVPQLIVNGNAYTLDQVLSISPAVSGN